MGFSQCEINAIWNNPNLLNLNLWSSERVIIFVTIKRFARRKDVPLNHDCDDLNKLI